MQNKNLIVISPSYTSALKSIIYSGKRLRQLTDNSALGKLQPGTISTIRRLQLNRGKTKKENTTTGKIESPQNRQE